MATTLYLRDNATYTNNLGKYRHGLSTTAGASTTTQAGINTTGSGPIYFTITDPLTEWLSPPLSAQGNITSAPAVRLYAYETNMAANYTVGCEWGYITAAGVRTSLGTYNDAVELGTSFAAMDFTLGTTTIPAGARIFIKPYATPIGTGVTGYGCYMAYDGAAGSRGSYISFTENLTFAAEPGASPDTSQGVGYYSEGRGSNPTELGKIPFATDAAYKLASAFPSQNYAHGGWVHKTERNGYFHGGVGLGTAIRKLPFATETLSSALASTMPVSVYYPGSSHSSTKGYSYGGSTTTYSTNIDEFVFSTETTANTSASLDSAKRGVISYTGDQTGVVAGGYGASGTTTSIGLFPYSTESFSNDSTTLGYARDFGACNVASSTLGYLSGGKLSPLTNYDHVSTRNHSTKAQLQASGALASTPTDSTPFGLANADTGIIGHGYYANGIAFSTSTISLRIASTFNWDYQGVGLSDLPTSGATGYGANTTSIESSATGSVVWGEGVVHGPGANTLANFTSIAVALNLTPASTHSMFLFGGRRANTNFSLAYHLRKALVPTNLFSISSLALPNTSDYAGISVVYKGNKAFSAGGYDVDGPIANIKVLVTDSETFTDNGQNLAAAASNHASWNGTSYGYLGFASTDVQALSFSTNGVSTILTGLVALGGTPASIQSDTAGWTVELGAVAYRKLTFATETMATAPTSSFNSSGTIGRALSAVSATAKAYVVYDPDSQLTGFSYSTETQSLISSSYVANFYQRSGVGPATSSNGYFPATRIVSTYNNMSVLAIATETFSTLSSALPDEESAWGGTSIHTIGPEQTVSQSLTLANITQSASGVTSTFTPASGTGASTTADVTSAGVGMIVNIGIGATSTSVTTSGKAAFRPNVGVGFSMGWAATSKVSYPSYTQQAMASAATVRRYNGCGYSSSTKAYFAAGVTTGSDSNEFTGTLDALDVVFVSRATETAGHSSVSDQLARHETPTPLQSATAGYACSGIVYPSQLSPPEPYYRAVKNTFATETLEVTAGAASYSSGTYNQIPFGSGFSGPVAGYFNGYGANQLNKLTFATDAFSAPSAVLPAAYLAKTSAGGGEYTGHLFVRNGSYVMVMDYATETKSYGVAAITGSYSVDHLEKGTSVFAGPHDAYIRGLSDSDAGVIFRYADGAITTAASASTAHQAWPWYAGYPVPQVGAVYASFIDDYTVYGRGRNTVENCYAFVPSTVTGEGYNTTSVSSSGTGEGPLPNKGYFVGGENTTSGIIGVVTNLDFGTDALSANGYALTTNRSNGVGISGPQNGYVCGGYTSGITASTSKLGLVNGVTSIHSAVLSQARRNSGAVQSSIKGYVGGGYHTDPPLITVNTIDGITFQTESAFTSSFTMVSNRYNAGGVQSYLKGYFGGGVIDGATLAFEIDGVDFATDTATNSSSTLVSYRQAAAGVSSSTKGYWVGGHNGAVMGSIEAMLFSSEAVTTPAATLATARWAHCGVSSLDAGYLGGGDNGTTLDTCERFDFDTEIMTTLGTQLQDPVFGVMGVYVRGEKYLGESATTVADTGNTGSGTVSDFAAISGTGGNTASVTSSGSGSVSGAAYGTGAVTIANMTSYGEGVVIPVRVGTGANTVYVTSEITGKALVRGTGVGTLSVSSSAEGVVPINGQGDVTVSISGSSTGRMPAVGAFSPSETMISSTGWGYVTDFSPVDKDGVQASEHALLINREIVATVGANPLYVIDG